MQQLHTAIQHSHGVVAAFCRADALSADTRAQLPAPHGAAGTEDNSDFQARRAAARWPVLVGLARASSDGACVGVVDSLLLLPELHDRGLGRQCASYA